MSVPKMSELMLMSAKLMWFWWVVQYVSRSGDGGTGYDCYCCHGEESRAGKGNSKLMTNSENQRMITAFEMDLKIKNYVQFWCWKKQNKSYVHFYSVVSELVFVLFDTKHI